MADYDFEYKNILLIDKPRGISSNYAINRIKHVIKNKLQITNKYLPKIGHGGTLDPEATGLLIIGITRVGTKKLSEQIGADKIYECDIDLLKQSETGDMEIFEQFSLDDFDRDIPSIDEIKNLIDDKFIGEVEQTPPIYSALKVNGKKACDLARQGIDVKLKSRKITIYDIQILNYDFPVLSLKLHCSKGTYIRTIGMDIGAELNLCGTLLNLRRIKSGDYSINDSIELDKLTFDDLLC